MTKASRNARRKAEKARDKAGGLTNYTLFTPIALGEVDEKKLLGRSWNRFQVNDPNNPAIQQDERVETEGTEKEKVMNSLDFTKIKRRLYAYRQQLRHADGLDGDMGASQARKPEASNKASNPNPNSNANSKPSTPTRPPQTIQPSPDKTGSSAHPLSKQQTKDEDETSLFDFDHEFGDLALPPPALDLDDPSSGTTTPFHPASGPASPNYLTQLTPQSKLSQSTQVRGRNSTTSSGNSVSADASLSLGKIEKDRHAVLGPRRTKKKEQKTGWHMSDVPLTPFLNETRRQQKVSQGETGVKELDQDLDFEGEEDFGAGFVGSPIWSGNHSRNQGHQESIDTPPTFKARHAHFSAGGDTLKSSHQSFSKNQSQRSSSKQPELGGFGNGENDNGERNRSNGSGGDPSPPPPLSLLAGGNQAGGAWWLDISCPTYADMVQLSKVSLDF